MAATESREGIKDILRKLLPGSESKYVPLPPEGNTLPAVVRRKFSFPAQLPNISTLSLLPDFNSTQHDHLDDTLTLDQNIHTSDEVHPLRIRYSLIRSMEPISEQPSRPSTPSLRRKPERITERGSVIVSPRSEDSDGSTQPSDSLTNATTVLDVTPRTSHSPDNITSLSPKVNELVQTEPRSAQEYSAERISSKGKIFLSVRDQIAWKLKRHIPQILRTFCIVDLQFPGHPIAVVSKELLPRHSLSPNEAHFLTDNPTHETSQIRVETHNGKKVYRIILQGDLYSCYYSSSSNDHPTHRYIAHLDLTPFVESVRSGPIDIWAWEAQEPDIWLQLAHEEMRKSGIPIDDPPVRYEAKAVSKKDRLDIAMEVIGCVYRDFFVLGVLDRRGGYEISHVSRSLLELGDEVPDLASLAAGLARGECFCGGLMWGVRRRVYCVPMYGPRLNSWLCFLVDGALPVLW